MEYRRKRAKANRVLPSEYTGHSKHPLSTTQEKPLQMAITRWSTPIFFAAKNGEALNSQQKQDWEECGSDHEFLIAKFRLKLKKLGKTTRPFGMS